MPKWDGWSRAGNRKDKPDGTAGRQDGKTATGRRRDVSNILSGKHNILVWLQGVFYDKITDRKKETSGSGAAGKQGKIKTRPYGRNRS